MEVRTATFAWIFSTLKYNLSSQVHEMQCIVLSWLLLSPNSNSSSTIIIIDGSKGSAGGHSRRDAGNPATIGTALLWRVLG